MYDLSKATSSMGVLWDKYHAYQLGLAKRGIATDHHAETDRKIRELQDEVTRLTSELKDSEDKRSELWDIYLNDIVKSKSANPMIVEERML